MICKRCHADESFIVNLGHKEHYDHFNTREYCCTSCGYRFRTKEDFYQESQPKIEQPDLFSNVKRKLVNG